MDRRDTTSRSREEPVYLRPLEGDDIERIHNWHNDRGLYDTLTGVFRYVSRGTVEAWLQKKQASDSTEVNLAICLRRNHDHLGNVYLREIDWIHRRGELGIFIGDTSHRFKGRGLSALRLMVSYAVKELGLRRLYGLILAENRASIRIFEACGFVTEGTLRQHFFKQGKLRDAAVVGFCANHPNADNSQAMSSDLTIERRKSSKPSEQRVQTIYVRCLEPEDLDVVSRWLAEDAPSQLIRGITGPASRASLEQWIHEKRGFSADEMYLTACRDDDGGPIGVFTVRDIDWLARNGELCVLIGEKTWASYETVVTAVRLVMRHVFDDLGLLRLFCFVPEKQQAHIECLSECGFEVEARMRAHHFHNGCYQDVVVLGYCVAD